MGSARVRSRAGRSQRGGPAGGASGPCRSRPSCARRRGGGCARPGPARRHRGPVFPRRPRRRCAGSRTGRRSACATECGRPGRRRRRPRTRTQSAWGRGARGTPWCVGWPSGACRSTGPAGPAGGPPCGRDRCAWPAPCRGGRSGPTRCGHGGGAALPVGGGGAGGGSGSGARVLASRRRSSPRPCRLGRAEKCDAGARRGRRRASSWTWQRWPSGGRGAFVHGMYTRVGP